MPFYLKIPFTIYADFEPIIVASPIVFSMKNHQIRFSTNPIIRCHLFR